MLYKEICCPKCNGHGFISHSEENGIWSENCTDCCNGTIVVPMTNGDIIRTCNNEELVKVHHNLNQYALYSGGENNRLLDSSPEDFLLWINKKADDIDIRTIFDFVDEKEYEHPYLKVMNI